MPIYRITFGFSGAEQGWTENHMCFSSSTVPLTVFNGNAGGVGSINAVAQARAAFLAREFSIVGVRVSQYSDGAVPPLRLPRSHYLSKKVYAPGITTKAGAGEPTPVQLEASGTAVQAGIDPKFFGNQNFTYLGGPWDDAVNNAGQVFPDVNNLNNLFNDWKAAMLAANMGWGAVNKLIDLEITAITQNTDGTVQLTTLPGTLPPLVINGTFQGRIRGVNNGRSPLNGQVILQCLSATSFKTKEVIAFSTPQNLGFLGIYSPVLTFIPYANLTLQQQTIKHKRGKPFFTEPGRAKKRIRG